MKCPRCGSEIGEGRLFCESCGEEIRIVKDYVPGADEFPHDTVREPETEQPSGPEKKQKRRKKSLSRVQKAVIAGACLLLALILLNAAAYGLRYHSAQYQYEKALEYVEKKNYERAWDYAERAVALEPGNVEYLETLLTCLASVGERTEAEELCGRILSLDPVNQPAYRRLISFYEEDGDYEKINELLLECESEQIVSQYPAYLAKPPEFSYKSGAYHETLSLKLIGNTSGVIYYTMDGTQPDENSLVYASPIFLESGNYRIRAIFVNDYGVASKEAMENYYVDVTVPDAPLVEPEPGNFSRPTLITVTAGENCSVYYTVDGSKPTQDSIQYASPIPMPVGVSHFRFISYSAAGVASEETSLAYSLNLHAALSIEAARNMLLIELIRADVIQNISGSVKTGTGHNVYNYRYAITVEDVDYYLYREYYEDDAGNRASTGNEYVVSVMDGQCYKAVQVQQALAGVSDNSVADPWSTMTLQEISSEQETASE